MLCPVLGDALSHEALPAWVLVVQDGAPVAAGEIGQEDFRVVETLCCFVGSAATDQTD